MFSDIFLMTGDSSIIVLPFLYLGSGSCLGLFTNVTGTPSFKRLNLLLLHRRLHAAKSEGSLSRLW